MAYWVVSAALVVFGFLASFSIGRPFLLVGLAMLVLGRVRHRPLVFWPPMLAVVAWNLVYWALVPFSCTATQAPGAPSRTVCSSLTGIRFEGQGAYNPSLLPATIAGVVVAALLFVLSLAYLWWNRRMRTSR